MLRTSVVIALAGLLCGGLTACDPGADDLATRAQAEASAHAAALATMPARFHDGGSGLGWAWDAAACTTADGACRLLDVYAYQACDTGYVEGDLLTDSKTVAGFVNGSLSAMRAGATKRIRLEWDEAKATSVQVTTVECH